MKFSQNKKRMLKLSALISLLIFTGITWSNDLHGISYEKREDVQLFIQEMVKEHGYDKQKLDILFAGVNHQAQVIKAYSKRAEKVMIWPSYRKLFVKPQRISLGVEFWKKHQKWLDKAEKETGVPAQLIVAIIGVESRFGSHKGKNHVLDSLTTLAFDRKKRQAFFRKELKEFLLLCDEQGFDPKTLTGSYAGAMGVPQFISSSYRNYAVDFDQNGQIDLFTSVPDVIGSVANYFKLHGWVKDGRVTSSAKTAQIIRTNYAAGKGRYGLKPEKTAKEFKDLGWGLASSIPDTEKLTLLAFDYGSESRYLFGHQNFYVITRYNQSSMYALAAHQLSLAIKRAYRASLKS